MDKRRSFACSLVTEAWSYIGGGLFIGHKYLVRHLLRNRRISNFSSNEHFGGVLIFLWYFGENPPVTVTVKGLKFTPTPTYTTLFWCLKDLKSTRNRFRWLSRKTGDINSLQQCMANPGESERIQTKQEHFVNIMLFSISVVLLYSRAAMSTLLLYSEFWRLVII